MQDQMTDAAIAALGSKTTVAGAATSGVGFFLMSNAFIGYLGLAIALAGLVINTFFRWRDFRSKEQFRRREDDRREREHCAMMEKLTGRAARPRLPDEDHA